MYRGAVIYLVGRGSLLGLRAIWCPGHCFTLNKRFVNWFISHDSQNGCPASKLSDSRALTVGMNLGTLFKEDQGIINLRAVSAVWLCWICRGLYVTCLLTEKQRQNTMVKRWQFWWQVQRCDLHDRPAFYPKTGAKFGLGIPNQTFPGFIFERVKNYPWRALQRWFVYKNIPLMMYLSRNLHLLKPHTFSTLWC